MNKYIEQAIREVANTENPEAFAALNQTAYLIAQNVYEQMTKRAVNATVGFRFHRLSFDLKDNGIDGFESGDKVKLIIVNEG